MKLTGDLKEKVEKVNSKAEAKEIIKDAGMILTDDELDAVSGGADQEKSELDKIREDYKETTRSDLCPYCNTETGPDAASTPWYLEGHRVERYVCEHCNQIYSMIY